MSVTSTKLMRSRTFGADNTPSLKATRVYLVQCSSSADGPDVAAAAVPQRGVAYSGTYPGLIVSEIDSKEYEKSGIYFEVSVNYATKNTKADNPDPLHQNPDPTARPSIVRLTFDSYEEQAMVATAEPDAVDSDNAAIAPLGWKWKTAIVNSAGQPFDPSITKTYRDPVITIEKCLSSVPWTLAKDNIDKINSDAFNITYRSNNYAVAAGQAWLFDLTSEPGYENGVAYERATCILKIRADGWKRKILDQGKMQLNNGDPPPKPIRDANGDPINSPALLDGKGGKLAADGKPVWLRFQLHSTAVFGTILSAFLT